VAAILRALQGGIESLYRVETDLDVCDFLVGNGTQRQAREQLLIRQHEGEMHLGLFVDERTLENLAFRDPARRLDELNLQDFLRAVEGVSHFVYLAHRAQMDRPVSAVELELQAEVDKYLVALLVWWNQLGEPPDGLRERLFHRVTFAGDLSAEERDRYQLAHNAALSYVRSLEDRFLRTREVRGDDMLAEARRFYRKGFAQKLEHITQLAA
jgi:hypothetical protein